jgi:hypothetical protein
MEVKHSGQSGQPDQNTSRNLARLSPTLQRAASRSVPVYFRNAGTKFGIAARAVIS